MKYVAPSISHTAFTCPICEVLTTQYWYSITAKQLSGEVVPRDRIFKRAKSTESALIFSQSPVGPFIASESDTGYQVANIWIARCHNCQSISIWRGYDLIFPDAATTPPKHPETPEHVAPDYDEAAAIASRSPRGAAALLRLAIEKLCQHLCENEDKVNNNIRRLVQNGIPVQVQQMLDTLRVIGNESVHPGTLDLRDEPDTAAALFRIFNLIVEKMISEPAKLDEIYRSLPEEKLNGIRARDARPRDEE